MPTPANTDTTTIESSRFGTLQVPASETIEFPLGLIGLAGSRDALIERNAGSGFQGLHSLEDPNLALPVVDPRSFFPAFELALGEEDRERIGAPDPVRAQVYVTLRAPPVIHAGRGHQVLNSAPGAELRTPLFPDRRPRAVDAA